MAAVVRLIAQLIGKHDALHHALRINEDMRLTVNVIFANPVGPDVTLEAGHVLHQRRLAKVVKHILAHILTGVQALKVGWLQHLLHPQQALVCIQHEMDHLMGKVFVEYLSPLKRNRIKTKLVKLQKQAAR